MQADVPSLISRLANEALAGTEEISYIRTGFELEVQRWVLAHAHRLAATWCFLIIIEYDGPPPGDIMPKWVEDGGSPTGSQELLARWVKAAGWKMILDTTSAAESDHTVQAKNGIRGRS